MTAQRIDGRALAQRIRSDVTKTIDTNDLRPGLGVILVGSDSASHLYIDLKERAAEEVGVDVRKQLFNEHATEDEILAHIEALNADDSIHGILVQLPLPDHFDTSKVIGAIDPRKDVDGFHPETVAAFMDGSSSATPPLIGAVQELVRSTGEELEGKRATLLVNSDIFATPLAHGLKQLGVESSICIVPQQGVCESASQSDILITAIGQKHAITSEHVKGGAIIIDIGITREDDKVYGDVHPDVARKASHITPVPGGVGPMTIALLLHNVAHFAKNSK